MSATKVDVITTSQDPVRRRWGTTAVMARPPGQAAATTGSPVVADESGAGSVALMPSLACQEQATESFVFDNAGGRPREYVVSTHVADRDADNN